MMAKDGAELLSLSKRDFKRLIFIEFREIGKEIFKSSLKKKRIFRNAYKKTLKKYRNMVKKKKEDQKDLMVTSISHVKKLKKLNPKFIFLSEQI
jgi:hypothetical protein